MASGIATILKWSFAAVASGNYLDLTKAVNPRFVWWFYSLVNLLSVVFVVVLCLRQKARALNSNVFIVVCDP